MWRCRYRIIWHRFWFYLNSRNHCRSTIDYKQLQHILDRICLKIPKKSNQNPYLKDRQYKGHQKKVKLHRTTTEKTNVWATWTQQKPEKRLGFSKLVSSCRFTCYTVVLIMLKIRWQIWQYKYNGMAFDHGKYNDQSVTRKQLFSYLITFFVVPLSLEEDDYLGQKLNLELIWNAKKIMSIIRGAKNMTIYSWEWQSRFLTSDQRTSLIFQIRLYLHYEKKA